MARVPGQRRPTLESKLETLLFELVQTELHAMPIKLMPTRTGLPDRLVLFPGGEAHFIELKRENGRTAILQAHQHQRLRRLGFYVHVLTGEDEIRNWVARQQRIRQMLADVL